MERVQRPKLNEELLESAPDDYYERKLQQIKAGETVWLRRNFDSAAGLCIDLFSNTQHLGYIASDFDNPYRPARGFTAVAYIMVNGIPELLEPGSIEKPGPPELAAFELFQYCERTGAIGS